ncbi:MAG: 3-oxoacyl-ACP synthase, partial [Nitrospirae bacterium]|nr:3-oxoacyl-ACP synthase [Nitrospirota bacterium]
AIEYFEKAITEALESNDIGLDQIDLFIFHQANFRLLEKIRESFKIPEEKVEMTIDRFGNTSSASIPITLDSAVAKKKIKKGDHVLFASFGGGITWASAVYRW